MKQVYLNGKGHHQLVQSWLPQNPTMSPPSPLSRPGSSNHMLPSQFSESQESAPVVPKRRPKRKASPTVAQPQKRHKSGVTEAMEKLQAAVEEARGAIEEEERAIKKLSKRTREYKERQLEVGIARHECQKLVKAPKAPKGEAIPFDHRERERRDNFGPRPQTMMCAEEDIASGERKMFFEKYTKSVNQRDGALAGDEAFKKSRPTTATIHWNNMRRWLGVKNLAPGSDGLPIKIRDVLTEANVRDLCSDFETKKSSRNKKFSEATMLLYARMWSAVGKVFILDKSELEDWQKMSSHRIKDAIQTRKDEGDVSAESEAANQTTMKPTVTFFDMLHRRKQFMEKTNCMIAEQTASDWPPSHWPASTFESQRILLARRTAALLGNFFITHVPPMRDEAGCGLIWNRHIKIMDVDGTKILQYRNRCPRHQVQPTAQSRATPRKTHTFTW